jgi:hypothetical protein
MFHILELNGHILGVFISPFGESFVKSLPLYSYCKPISYYIITNHKYICEDTGKDQRTKGSRKSE